MTTALWLLAVVLVLIGIAGTVLPVLPGTVLVFAGLALGAWAQDFSKVGGSTIAVLGVLTVLSFVVDFAASALGARRVGASRAAVAGAAIGTIAGIPFGIVGLLGGPFLGAVVGELISAPDVLKAGKVGVGAWLGFFFGTVLKLALAFAMVGIFAVAYIA
ncbi:MAG: DUF456 domain-containing protein [Rhodospirillaceae bacterium]